MQNCTAQMDVLSEKGQSVDEQPRTWLQAPCRTTRCCCLERRSFMPSDLKGKVMLAALTGLVLAGLGLIIGGSVAGARTGCFAAYQACRSDDGGMSACQAAADDECHFTTHVALIATGCAICVILVPLIAASAYCSTRRQEQMELELGNALRRASSGAIPIKVVQQQGTATTKGIPANVTLTYVPKSIYGPDLDKASSSSESGDDTSGRSSEGSPRAEGGLAGDVPLAGAQWCGLWPAGGPPGPPDWAGAAAAAMPADMPPYGTQGNMHANAYAAPKVTRFSFFKQVRVFPVEEEVAA